MTAQEKLAEHIFETVTAELADHVLTVTLNRPERKNAINQVMIDELCFLFGLASSERDVRVLVLAAAGDTFCAGGDLKALSGEGAGERRSSVPEGASSDEMTLKLYHLGKPCIAKIEGPVYAGALLMVCNVTHAIAVDTVHFSAPEIRRGLWPCQVMAGLFRMMPRRQAMDFIMRGERISARAAEAAGLINQAVPASRIDGIVSDLARELASLAPDTMRLGLTAMRAQEPLQFDEALPMLREAFIDCLGTEDAQEGLAAFRERRAPNWR